MAEFLDCILYADDEICTMFGSEKFVNSVLEAIDQIEDDHPEVRDQFCHILQMITITNSGLQAVNEHSERIFCLVENILKSSCDEDFMNSKDRLCGLASAVIVVRATWSCRNSLTSKSSVILSFMLKLMWVICQVEKNDDLSKSVKELVDILKDSILSAWCDVIEDYGDKIGLDVLEKGPEKEVELLVGELKNLPQSGCFDSLTRLVLSTGQYNKLAEIIKL